MRRNTILSTALAAIVLLAGCESIKSAARESGSPDESCRYHPQPFYQGSILDEYVRNEFLKQSGAMEEEDLSQRVDDPKQIVRLILLPAMPSFTEAVRIEMSGDRITLTAKRAPKQCVEDSGDRSFEKHAELTPQQWSELQARLSDVDFWNLPTGDNCRGFDGAHWIVEGVSGGRYHIVNRWSPRPESRYGRLTAYMMELAGFP